MSGGTFDAILTNGMASIRGAAEAAGKSVANLTSGFGKMGAIGEREFGRIGTAVAKMGGPTGELGGKFFGAMGLSGGIGKLAIAAVAAGVAFKAFGAAMEMARARAMALAEAANGLRNAMRAASEARRDFAAGSADIGKTQARAENLFGQDAGGRARMLSEAYGVETGDVLGAMAGSGGLRKEHRGQALEAALAAAATGEMTVSEAMGMLSDPATRALVLGQKSGEGLSASQRGGAQLILRRRGGHGPEALREALDTVGSSGPARGQLGSLARAENIAANAQLDSFTSGETAGAVKDRNERAVAPGRKEFEQWLRAQNEAIAKLMDASRKAGAFWEWFANKKAGPGGLFGEGSYADQAGRANDAKVNAIRDYNGMGEDR